ncbi:MAG: hypothetical protein GEU28_08485 [Dehalococcoidia bacterium]|nr:hypothetical protein [Dehalococcoidia bacterium]
MGASPHSRSAARRRLEVSGRANGGGIVEACRVIAASGQQYPDAGLVRERGSSMVKAYVLVVTNPGKTKLVVAGIKDLEGVVECHEVMGPYDIVVEVEAEQLSDIPKILSEGIRPLDGIESTSSLVTFPQ